MRLRSPRSLARQFLAALRDDPFVAITISPSGETTVWLRGVEEEDALRIMHATELLTT